MSEDKAKTNTAACCSKRAAEGKRVPRVRYATVGDMAGWLNVSADEVCDALCRLQLTHEICVLEFRSGLQLVNVRDFGVRCWLVCRCARLGIACRCAQRGIA